MTSARPTTSARPARAVWLAAACLALVATLLPGRPAAGDDAPSRVASTPVAPGLVRENWTWHTLGGPQKIQVLRYRLADDRLTLTPELARGVVPGREPVHHTLLRLGEDAVAAVNGGFWLGAPDGDPEGLVVREGHYLSEPATQGAGPRAAFALFPDDTWAVGRPDYVGKIWFPSGVDTRLSGINKEPGPDQLVAFTSAYAPSTLTPEDTVEAVFDVELSLKMLGSEPVESIRQGGNSPIPAGKTVLAGRGRWADELRRLEPGDLVAFDVRTSVDWQEATASLAAGPMLIQDGVRVPRHEWQTEGFDHKVHNDRAHPRTAIGFTADGEVLLVTIDGRQPSRAVGLTTDETIDLMLELGAVDALMMDGGGSSTMAVDGRITNVPCCDAPGYRSVASSLVLRSTVETPDVTRMAGGDRYATAAAVARAGWPDGVSEALLASGTTFPDGLAAGPLAARRNLPLLLTGTETLPPATGEAITELGVTKVTVLGGEAAVAPPVVKALEQRGVEVARMAGANRAATARAVARQLGAPAGRAILVSGRAWPDALSAISPAHAAQAPLLLTGRDEVDPETLALLDELGVRDVVVAGGTAVVSAAVVEQLQGRGFAVARVAGANRFETSAALADWAEAHAGFTPRALAVAAGADFPDALAGGPFAALRGAPVLLVERDAIARTPAPSAWLDRHAIDAGYVFGGRVAVSTWVGHELQAAVERS